MKTVRMGGSLFINTMLMKGTKCSTTNMICMILLIVGGLNWGLVGAFNFDLVAYLFGAMTPLARVVYVLVGVAALIMALASCGKGCCGGSCKADKK